MEQLQEMTLTVCYRASPVQVRPFVHEKFVLVGLTAHQHSKCHIASRNLINCNLVTGKNVKCWYRIFNMTCLSLLVAFYESPCLVATVGARYAKQVL